MSGCICNDWEGDCSWRAISRGQECCLISHNVQESSRITNKKPLLNAYSEKNLFFTQQNSLHIIGVSGIYSTTKFIK